MVYACRTRREEEDAGGGSMPGKAAPYTPHLTHATPNTANTCHSEQPNTTCNLAHSALEEREGGGRITDTRANSVEEERVRGYRSMKESVRECVPLA